MVNILYLYSALRSPYGSQPVENRWNILPNYTTTEEVGAGGRTSNSSVTSEVPTPEPCSFRQSDFFFHPFSYQRISFWNKNCCTSGWRFHFRRSKLDLFKLICCLKMFFFHFTVSIWANSGKRWGKSSFIRTDLGSIREFVSATGWICGSSANSFVFGMKCE